MVSSKCKCIKDYLNFRNGIIYEYYYDKDDIDDAYSIVNVQDSGGIGSYIFLNLFNEYFIDIHRNRKKVIEKLLNI
jgi:hypothetical protein